jgi:prepilin-type N-terminal cleavage/methylation domain-containing protein
MFARPSHFRDRKAFTLIEVLVTIGIIVVLISILVPAVGRIRRSAYVADTQAMLNSLAAGIERYRQDFSAFPGPLANDQMGATALTLRVVTPIPAGFAGGNIVQNVPATVPGGAAFPTFVSITGTHNLVLGLLGGLSYDPNAPSGSSPIVYNPSLVGQGPSSLNPANLRSFAAYAETRNLSWRQDATAGRTGAVLYEDSLTANDCIIPSFMDRFPDAMPVIYLRARVGATSPAAWRTSLPSGGTGTAQYDLAHAIGYTTSRIGNPAGITDNLDQVPGGSGSRENTSPGTHGLRSNLNGAVWGPPMNAGNVRNSSYNYPYPFNLYVANPANPTQARNADGYIIITAGPDRIYGTNDDITTFGQITP